VSKASAARSADDALAAVIAREATEALLRYPATDEQLAALHVPPSVAVGGYAPPTGLDRPSNGGSSPSLMARVAILAGVVLAATTRIARPSIAVLAAKGADGYSFAKSGQGRKARIKVKKAKGNDQKKRTSREEAAASSSHDGFQVEVSTNNDFNKPLDYRVLVMDVSYRPVDVIDWKQGLLLDLRGKGDVLEYYDKSVRSARDEWPLPAVVVTKQHAHQLTENYAPTKMNIQARDNYSCQYCGTEKKPFTIDHVMPKSRDGEWTWDNLVCCCPVCNSKKGNRTPNEANMPLRRTPRAPKPGSLAPPRLRSNLRSARKLPPEWTFYIQRMPFMKKYLAGEGAKHLERTAGNVKPTMLPADTPPAGTDEDTFSQLPV
jgi:5-methylcytosine-specific restriction endonuclease McrA